MEDTMTGKMAVIYARYSSSAQRDVSIEQQVNECRRFASRMGLEVIAIYDDHAISGRTDNRPMFQQMIKDSASRSFQYVLVYALDRFSRDRYDSAVNKHTLKNNGVRVLSVTENITDDPMGVIMESLLEGMAEYYSKELSRKIRRGYQNNAEKCMVIGPPPLGYRKGADGRYEIVPEEAAIVEEIFRRVSNHERFVDIFRDLNGRGVKTKTGTEWSRSSLNKILHSEKYVGVYQYAGIRIDGGVPAIVDRQTFDIVQEYCKVKPKAQGMPQRRRQNNGTYILTGKLCCGSCKAPMVGIAGTGKHGEKHYYYVCRNRKATKECEAASIQRDLIEAYITREISRILEQPAVMDWFCDCTKQYFENNSAAEEIRLMRSRLDSLVKDKENTLKAIRSGITSDSVGRMLAEIEAEESSLRAKIALAEDRNQIQFSDDDVKALAAMLKDGDLTDKRYQERMIDAFLVRAVVHPDHLLLVFNFTGKMPDEIEVPFNLEELKKAPQVQTYEASENGAYSEPLAAQGFEAGSYNPKKWTFGTSIRTPSIYFLAGLAMEVVPWPPTK